MKTKRCIEAKKFPIILSILFGVIMYIMLLFYFDNSAVIESTKLNDFYQKYTMYTPLVFGIFSLVLFLVLILIKVIFRIKSAIFNVLVYFFVFGIFLVLGIDLLFFEPRDADFARTIINTFGLPLIVSSGSILLIVILLYFKKTKTVEEK